MTTPDSTKLPPEIQEIVVERVLKVLNRILSKDHKATTKLFSQLIPCNKELADDPTIPVRTKGDQHHFGLTGVLNGVLQEALELERAPIAKMISENRNILAFVRYDPDKKKG